MIFIFTMIKLTTLFSRLGLICSMCFTGFVLHAQVNTSVSIVKTSEKAGIGNGYINRDFSIVGGKLKTTSITNFRTDGAPTVFTPGTKSEEFVISPVKNLFFCNRGKISSKNFLYFIMKRKTLKYKPVFTV